MAFKLEDDLGFLMARTHRAMRQALMSRLEPLGITYRQFQVLNALCEADDVSQIGLADRVNMDQTSLARMLARIEEAGLIDRAQDPSDFRVNRITLTDKGRHLALQVAPLRERVLARATGGLSEKEVAELKRLLNKIYRDASS
ncbi:MAG: MarR family winged helix-turn-helix transcriptional regulator [Anaerolineae bacterium]|jgi:DNA-binding MarR family transcriptional regulator